MKAKSNTPPAKMEITLFGCFCKEVLVTFLLVNFSDSTAGDRFSVFHVVLTRGLNASCEKIPVNCSKKPGKADYWRGLFNVIQCVVAVFLDFSERTT
jgi:hypothetical protein